MLKFASFFMTNFTFFTGLFQQKCIYLHLINENQSNYYLKKLISMFKNHPKGLLDSCYLQYGRKVRLLHHECRTGTVPLLQIRPE